MPCSKLSKCFNCHFKLDFYSWVSVSGLECTVQSFEINSIHPISLISMISHALAKVCNFTDRTKPERIRNILPAAISLAHASEIQLLFKIVCEFIMYKLATVNWGKMYMFFVMQHKESFLRIYLVHYLNY